MARFVHEIRDPIHDFIRLDNDERRVLDSRPLQRLRHIHQLAMTWLVYPGATHRRFEHSLGVMELAGRVYDAVTEPRNVSDDMRRVLAPLTVDASRIYWRRAVRMAALCHDIGHLPFSHAAEKELLPEGWDHERLTRRLVSSAEMQAIWASLQPPLTHTHVEKLAVGPKRATDLEFSDWEEVLSEIVVGDAFGVDRMDYLLRDSHHAGVAYGKFDHHRLVDSLRILPATHDDRGDRSFKPELGIEEGGLQSAEALAFARYFMYSQVYFHRVRRIYDIHLMDFLKTWLPGGWFPIDVEEHLALTDSSIVDALWRAAFDRNERHSELAHRVVRREHFQPVYELSPEDARRTPYPGERVCRKLAEEYDRRLLRHDYYRQSRSAVGFPVRKRGGDIVSSLVLSDALNNVPLVTVDRVFADRSIAKSARNWVERHCAAVIEPAEAEEDNDE